ncbi:serum amyloid P-component-like [Eucyclogobius newberryi]|uniref:serum amyloid P-component-like n=1 Tax=Eucyclogobius newberryi TaxID=166745 RepID=UPI003B5BEE47
MLGLSLASPQDLSGKMITFPLETNSAHVKITTSTQKLGAATVCLRFFTDLTRDFGLFSMATPSHDNCLLIFKKQQSDEFQVFVKDSLAVFNGQDYKTNTWQSVCTTWDSATGLTQMWLNGAPSSRKFTSTTPINGPIIIVLGQEQDSHGGNFDAKQSYVGMISDLHMWNDALSPDQIYNYTHNLNVAHGNILKWESLEFQKSDRIIIEDTVE